MLAVQGDTTTISCSCFSKPYLWKWCEIKKAVSNVLMVRKGNKIHLGKQPAYKSECRPEILGRWRWWQIGKI